MRGNSRRTLTSAIPTTATCRTCGATLTRPTTLIVGPGREKHEFGAFITAISLHIQQVHPEIAVALMEEFGLTNGFLIMSHFTGGADYAQLLADMKAAFISVITAEAVTPTPPRPPSEPPIQDLFSCRFCALPFPEEEERRQHEAECGAPDPTPPTDLPAL